MDDSRKNDPATPAGDSPADAEETLARIHAILDTTVDAIITIDDHGTVQSFNRAAEKMFGYSSAEVVGQNVKMLMPSPYRDNHDTYLKNYITTGVKKIIGIGREVVAQRKDGSTFPMELSVSEVKFRGHRTFTGIIRDITLRKQMEEFIHGEKDRIQAILDTTVDAIITIDDHGTVQSFNRAAERIFGYSSAEVIGQNVKMLMPSPYRDNHDAYLNNYITTGIKKIIGIGREVVGQRKDALTFPMELSVSEVQFQGHRTFTGIVRDITQRKQMEEALLAAKTAAEVANTTKSEFLASMSHEIRTPMNAIIGMSDLLWETKLDPEQKEYLAAFRKAGANLLALINDILDLSKVEAGQIELDEADFDLPGMVEKTCEMFSLKAHDKGLELASHIDPALPRGIAGDEARLRQILMNLISNSLKFTAEGEVVVDVAAESEDDCRVIIRFSVTDTGIGIPENMHESIFDRFTQADSSTTRNYGGTGLGLAISKRLVELMGGSIRVESVPGKGSVFSFTASFKKSDSVTTPEILPVADIKGSRALVIDDNATNRMILVETLAGWGIEAVEANSGKAGLEEFFRAKEAGAPYDFVLLDCRMPGMDGFEVAEKMNNELAPARAAILMLTSDAGSGHIAKAKAAGLTNYMTKPISKSKLLEAIEAAMGKRRASAKAEEKEAGDEVFAVGGKLHILLAEDSPDNRLLIKSYLKTTPYTLDYAENGQQAVEKVKDGGFDLVLMDMEMPVMDGYTASREIRRWEGEDEGRAHTPIIALTAYALKGDREKSLDAGCDDHINKPVKKKVLLDGILEHTRRRNDGG